jgi:F-type H+-transporting ATPase subunit epsilon
MIVTPERVVLDEMVNFIAVPMYDGELGILADRAPMTGRLGFGELRITHGDKTERFYVEGGFIQVRSNVVSILTPKSVPVHEINVTALESRLSSLTGTALIKANAQLRIARKTTVSH